MRADADIRRQHVHRVHQDFPSESSSVCRASKEDTFFWTSMINCACASCRCRRSISRFSFAMRWASATAGSAWRPRLSAPTPAVPLPARCFRQAEKLRRVDAFASQQRTNLARLGTLVRQSQDPSLLNGCNIPAPRDLGHFRVGDRFNGTSAFPAVVVPLQTSVQLSSDLP